MRVYNSELLFPFPVWYSSQQNETVVEVWGQLVGSGHWNLNLVRFVNDWEVDLVVRNFAK